MFNQMNRPYKMRSAGETINKIKEILTNLDLMPFESFHANPYPEIYSVRLELDKDKGSFGTNGKGRTEEFSLASGYAEFLERMQNGLFAIFSRTIISGLKNKYGFYYTPDEIYMTENEFYKLPEEILADIIRHVGENKKNFISSYFERLNFHKSQGIVSVPFYDTKNKKEIYLPLNLLLLTVGSNGMAAGNTAAEGIFQAISELTERWGAAEIFYKKLTPPTVPDNYLREFTGEYGIIQNIEKSGKYKITVKDFSAGKRIPSVGLIVENIQTKKYRLNVGSDTCFQVALSRCLTEVFQGIKDETAIDMKLLDVPVTDPECFIDESENGLYQRYREFGEFTKDNTGRFPAALFGNEPSYPFDPSVFTPRSTYEEEVKAYVKRFHENGYNVYLRDVGFLGFPAVFVYIPEISGLGRKNAPAAIKIDTFNIIELDKIEPFIFNLHHATNDQLLQITRALENMSMDATICGLFNVTVKQDSPWGQVTVAFLLTQIWYKLGNSQKAADYFAAFRKSRPLPIPYYDMAGRFLDLKTEGLSNDSILQQLKSEFTDTKTVEEVCHDLDNPQNIFNFMKFPRCPNCEGCPLNEDCLTTRRMNISDKLYPVMKNFHWDQTRLAWTTDV